MAHKPHFDSYVQRKIDHMRRIGVITGESRGTGRNGGACPDDLAKLQATPLPQLSRTPRET